MTRWIFRDCGILWRSVFCKDPPVVRRSKLAKMQFDRSRFMDRELLDPARVMEGGYSSRASAVHTGDNLDFLKNAVDLGVCGAFPL